MRTAILCAVAALLLVANAEAHSTLITVEYKFTTNATENYPHGLTVTGRAQYATDTPDQAPALSNEGVFRLQSHLVHIDGLRGNLTPSSRPAPYPAFTNDVTFLFNFTRNPAFGTFTVESTFEKVIPSTGETIYSVGFTMGGNDIFSSDAPIAPFLDDARQAFDQFSGQVRLLKKGWVNTGDNYGLFADKIAVRVTECKDDGQAYWGDIKTGMAVNCRSESIGPTDAEDTDFVDFF